MKRYAYQLDTLRLIAMLLIFGNHALMILHAGEEGQKIFYTYLKYGIYALEYFVILSGCLAAYLFNPDTSQGKKSYIQYMTKKAVRLFPMHWACMLLFLPLSFVFYDFTRVLISIPATFCLLHTFSPYTVMPINGPSWTISALFVYYMFTPWLMSKIHKHVKTVWHCIACIAILIICEHFWLTALADYFPNDSWNYNSGIHCHIFTYLIGLFTGQLLKITGSISIRQHYFTLLEVLTCTLLVCQAIFGYKQYIAMCPITVLLIYVFFQGKGLISKILSFKPLWQISKLSFGFYLTHFFFIHLTLYMSMFKWKNFDSLTLHQGIILTLFALVASFLASWILHILIEKKLTPYLSERILSKIRA